MHTVFALLCFVVVIHWLIFPYPSGLLHWHCGNLTIAPVPAKQPWWIWINTSCELIMNDCITTTKQSTTKPCAYFLGYTVCTGFAFCCVLLWPLHWHWDNNTVDVRIATCYFDCLVQDFSNAGALAMEFLQSYIYPSICTFCLRGKHRGINWDHSY